MLGRVRTSCGSLSMSKDRVIAALQQAKEVYMLATGARLAAESIAESSSAVNERRSASRWCRSRGSATHWHV